MIMKRKKMLIGLLIAITMIVLSVGAFLRANWIPGKYAIRESEFVDYGPFILVREVHYTGTGWVQTGDENGCYLPERFVDISLDNGNVLPQMEMYDKDYANTFLCKVEYRGKVKHDAFEKDIDSYHIVEWYPVYPVLRDTILPECLYPKSFMTKQECGNRMEQKGRLGKR